MAVVAFGSVRSCGVTTLALSLAATWPPERRVLLVEADPAGGTLAAGSGWPAEPSLVSLAAAARRGGEPSLVWEHCHAAARRGGGAGRAVLGRPRPQRARACSTTCWAVSVSSTPTCWWTAAGSNRLGRPRAVGAGRPGGAGRAAAPGRPARSGGLARSPPSEGHRLGLVTVGDGPYPDYRDRRGARRARCWPACRGTPTRPVPWCRCRRRAGSCAWRRWSGLPGPWPTNSPPN